jgi:hypothetical protein
VAAILARDEAPPLRVSVDASDSVPTRTAIAAAVGFGIALLLTWLLPFRLRLRVMLAVRRARPERPPLQGTRQLVAAVKRVAALYPGWADCLEQSIGAFFAGALLGAPPGWRFGAETVGHSEHAWAVSAEGVAVDHSDHGLSPTAMIDVLPRLWISAACRQAVEHATAGGRCCAITPVTTAAWSRFTGLSRNRAGTRLGPRGHQGSVRTSSTER